MTPTYILHYKLSGNLYIFAHVNISCGKFFMLTYSYFNQRFFQSKVLYCIIIYIYIYLKKRKKKLKKKRRKKFQKKRKKKRKKEEEEEEVFIF